MPELRRRWQSSCSQKETQMKDLNLSRDELDALIDQWILGKNAERNRRLLKRRLFDGICYEPLAEEFEISDKRHVTS